MPGSVPQREDEPRRLLAEAEAGLARLDEYRAELAAKVTRLRLEAQAARSVLAAASGSYAVPGSVTMLSSEADKVRLFRSLFRPLPLPWP